MGAAVIVRTSARKVGTIPRDAVQADRDDHRRCEADDDEQPVAGRGPALPGQRVGAHASSYRRGRSRPVVDPGASVAERARATLTREG